MSDSILFQTVKSLRLSLDVIASNFGIDKYRLCHLFSSKTDTTVMNKLKKIRIKKSKKMLESSTISVEQIALMCGFESPSYFIKNFKSETGCTPNQYRKSMKATN